MRTNKLLLIAAVFILVAIQPALAHREDYLNNTFVYQTIEPGELELEYWLKYGSPDTRPTSLEDWQHTVSFENGINDHWMIEANTTFQHTGSDSFDHLITRVESRVKFFNEGDKFLDPAFSLEYSIRSDHPGTSHILEPTFVLSKDFQRLNFTLGLTAEKVLNSSEKTEYGYNLASRYDFQRSLRLGMEMQGSFESNSNTYLIPQVHLLFPNDLTAKMGAGIRTSGTGEKLFFKFMIEAGLEI